ncbi:hypothetical protein [Streptomyces sp. NPDC006335]|uniref:hypothetical protein n=1 Tax=Streptomyces sp. NPDC006335 TaxID=3156895 RepID=UPI00339EB894
MSSDDLSYESALARLAGERPRLASALHRAEKRRAQHAASLLTGARFKGLDELLRHLDSVAEAFKTNPQLSQLTFLISRSVADFETAAEATLSGYMAVAADAMRDVMEIENLLLDFAISPGHIEEWLTCDDKTRMSRFMPVVVRKRLHAAGVPPFATTAESVDYKAHSQALHVSPHQFPVARKGFSAGQGMDADAGFWEIFEHARRLHLALRRLTSRLQPDTAVHRLTEQELIDFEDAWQRTQQMQEIYMALIKATLEAQTENGEAI